MDKVKIAKNYAISLFEVINNDELQKTIFVQINSLYQAINIDPHVKEIIYSPIIQKNIKYNIIKNISKKFGLENLVENFLLLLIKNSRINIMKDILTYYKILLLTKCNIKLVKVISSKNLNISEQEEIKINLSRELKQDIEIDFLVDDSLMAGYVIEYDSKLIDYSVKGALLKIQNIAKKKYLKV